jgi:replication factor A1
LKVNEELLQKITNGEEVPNPIILQIVGSKRISGPGGSSDAKPRYRFCVSDGQYVHNFAILATEQNHIYESGHLSDYTIIKLNRHIISVVSRNEGKERRVLILFELEALHPGSEVGTKIGNPESIDSSKAGQKENVSVNQPQAAARPQMKKEYGNQSMNSSMMDLGEHLTMPIDSLSPYQNKWVIKARCTSKSAMRTWSNAKGEGKLFSFDLCDESGEIRATAFRDQAEKYYDMIEVDKVYYISKCQLKAANKQYSKLKNDYEMTVGNDTVIQECLDKSQIPEIKYEFVQIADIGEREPGSIVDVIGICKDVTDLTNFTSKAGRDMTKREVTLVDQTSAAITLTLWGDDARNFNGFDQPVVLVRGAKVGEYGGGKTLSGGNSVKINPDITEGHRLRGWFDMGTNTEFKSLSTRTQGNMTTEFVSFKEAKVNNLGSGDKPDYFSTVGFIHNIKAANSFYKACPNQDCNKKLHDNDNGTWRCEKCNTDVTSFKYRLLMNVSFNQNNLRIVNNFSYFKDACW